MPVLLTKPGKVVADTKTYLYLDPGRLLERAVSMWDPHIGMGTVTHQNIGYLFPMGPYYWVLHLVGVPAWVSQRLWLGSILFGAALGVLFLLRTLHVARSRRGRCHRAVHAHAVHARLLGPHLGDPPAVGGAAVDAGADHPRAAGARQARHVEVRRRSSPSSCRSSAA